MAFKVEDGAGYADANAYCSVAFADQTHTDLGSTTWSGDNTAKQAAITRATIFMDGLPWRGTKKSAGQALALPRVGAVDYDGFDFSSSVPYLIQRATALAALRELTDPGSLTPDLARGGVISSAKVGSISVTYAEGAPVTTLYTQIQYLVWRFLRPADPVSRISIFVGGVGFTGGPTLGGMDNDPTRTGSVL